MHFGGVREFILLAGPLGLERDAGVAAFTAAFTMRTYVHASDDDLKEGTKTLAKLHKIA